MRSLGLLIAGFGVLHAACDSSEPVDGTLLIGTAPSSDGTGNFVEVSNGGDILLHPGAQGGFHIYVHVRLDNESLARMEGQPLLERTARVVQNGLLASRASNRVNMMIPSSTDGFSELEQSIPLFLCPTPVDVTVANEPILLEIEATGEEGVSVQGSLEVIPRCPDDAQGEFCRRICV